jgi:hypothetical protein
LDRFLNTPKQLAEKRKEKRLKANINMDPDRHGSALNLPPGSRFGSGMWIPKCGSGSEHSKKKNYCRNLKYIIIGAEFSL